MGGQIRDHAHSLATSANQKTVYADLTLMPLALNISRNPHLLRLTEEVIETLNLTDDTVVIEQNMTRPVGYSERIKTAEDDTIFYARLTKNAPFTRFVKNRQTVATKYITMRLARDADGNYELRNVWLGRTYPALPGDPEETEASKDYWSTHAVVFNGQALIASTLTKDCPY